MFEMSVSRVFIGVIVREAMLVELSETTARALISRFVSDISSTIARKDWLNSCCSDDIFLESNAGFCVRR